MEKQTLRFLSQEDILSLDVNYADIMRVTEDAMSAHARGECQCPPKIHVNTRPLTYINAMPAYIDGGRDMSGLKWVGGYPDNRRLGMPVTWGLMILNDPSTGAPLAVMDCRWITAARTAAVAALCAKYCKAPNTRCMTIIGAGEQGKWNARFFKHTVPELKRIYISDIYPAAIEAYVAKMQPLLPDVEIVPLRDEAHRRQAIDESSILLSATQRGDKPIIYREMLHRGMLGVPLESTAWEGSVYTTADAFVYDDWNLIEAYAADGKYTDGLPEARRRKMLGGIINGDYPGRESEDDFIITSCHGIAISDVALAHYVYERALERAAGTLLTLLEEDDILR